MTKNNPISGFPAGNGAIHALMRSVDWSATALGDPMKWPSSLRAAVNLILGSSFPMFISWGPQQTLIYNAAYQDILGLKHPAAMGRPVLEVWTELHGWLAPLLRHTLAGNAIYQQNLPLMLMRDGYEEKAWFTFSYSPICNDDGINAGVFCVCTENTRQNNAEQRQVFQLTLADALRGLSDPAAILSKATALLGEYLNVSRVLICEHDANSGMATYQSCYTDGTVDPLNGAYSVASFGAGNFASLERGETWVCDDLNQDPRTVDAQIRLPFKIAKIYSSVAVPLHRDGVLIASLFVSFEKPRHWTPDEITLIEDVSERVWNAVELARTEKLFEAQLTAERDRLQELFKHAPGFIAVLRGPQLTFEMVNQAYYQLVGHRDLIGKSVREALPEIEGQGYFELLDDVFANKTTFTGREMRMALQREAGGPIVDAYIDLLYQPMTEMDGSVSGIFVQGYDVTAQTLAREDIRLANERWQLAIESAGDGVWDLSLTTGTILYSPRFMEMLGYPQSDLPEPSSEWEDRMHPDDLPRVLAAMKSCVLNTAPNYHVEYQIRCKNGSWKWVASRGMVVERDSEGTALRVTGTLSDISAKKQTEDQHWRQANFDALTGLPNRRLFRDRLDESVKASERNGLSLALFFLDLDRFKEANDLLGHDFGDLLLVEAGARISACVRMSDTVARLGGDEFTVILPGLNEHAHIEQTAQKIVDALAEPFHIRQETVYLSASIGVTLFSEDANSSEELIKNADQAMYAAKNSGRNRFSYFTPEMQSAADFRRRLSNDLRRALSTGQLALHYQPVVNLQTGRISKAEALLRWQHPTLGMVEPSRFIPIAEETGQIKRIGDWVFEQAAICSKRCGVLAGHAFQIAVNKSPAQFLIRSSEGDWIERLASLNVDGQSIVLEITEGLLMQASPIILDKLARYRAAGMQLALDDFGTGYSSLAYLKKLDIDYLKIDQSFVKDIAKGEEHWAIAESIIVMAHRLGIKVIAEGVETEAQKALLVAAGCDYGQGFLFSAAVPAAELERMLEDGDAPR